MKAQVQVCVHMGSLRCAERPGWGCSHQIFRPEGFRVVALIPGIPLETLTTFKLKEGPEWSPVLQTDHTRKPTSFISPKVVTLETNKASES